MKLKETGVGSGLRVEEEPPPSPWLTVVGVLFQIGLAGLLVLAVWLASKVGHGG